MSTTHDLYYVSMYNFYSNQKNRFQIVNGSFENHKTSGTMLWCKSSEDAFILKSRFRLWNPVLLLDHGNHHLCETEFVVALDIDHELFGENEK